MATCSTCRHWASTDQKTGQCTLLPPTPAFVYRDLTEDGKPVIEPVQARPIMAADEFCGSHQPRSLQEG